MKIADLEFYLLDPLRGVGNATERTLLTRLATSEGRHGWGEARTTWRAAELPARRDNLLSLLAGRNVFNVEELLEIDSLLPPPLRATIEMACWDLAAARARQPLCRLWGGEYRPRVPLAIRLPRSDPARTAQLARDLAERGFHTQVVVATGDVQRDAAVVAAVRQATAEWVKLRFDAGSRFSPDEARQLCGQMEKSGLEFAADPLAAGLDGFAALARQTTVPLAVSASVRTPADVLAVARGGAAPHVVIDVASVGGLWPARQCAIVAAAARLPVSLSGAAGLGVALAGVLHLAAATPNLALAHQCEAYQLHDDILAERLSIVDGTIAVPQTAGLGIEVDRARIETYQVT